MPDTMLRTESITAINKAEDTAMEKEKSLSLKRRWVIIEDDSAKAESLITFILDLHKEDEIYWLYIEENTYNTPTYFEEGEDSIRTFRRELVYDSGRWKIIEGEIYFYWCKSKSEFIQFFDEVNNSKGIILLDINLPILGGVNSLQGILKDKVRGFFHEDKQSIVCITSQAVQHAIARRAIAQEDNWIFRRIYTEGAGDWEFRGDTLLADCKDVVERSNAFWNRLYGKDNALETFLENMSTLNVSACHNFDNSDPVKFHTYQQRGTWYNTKMPIQLKYLIDFLDYTPDEFIQVFGLKNEKDYFKTDSNISECLKNLGTKDSHRISLMGVALVTWGAYRRCFGKEAQSNHLFIDALTSPSVGREVARNKSIVPPQQLETLHRTIKAYYKMLYTLFRSQSHDDYGTDLVKDVKLDETGFSIRFKNISPERLHASIARVYRDRFLSENDNSIQSVQESSGDTARAIVKFFALNNYCDRLIMNKTPYISSFYGLKVYAAGEYPENGVIFKFGNE